jgi:hypothetical protein
MASLIFKKEIYLFLYFLEAQQHILMGMQIATTISYEE